MTSQLPTVTFDQNEIPTGRQLDLSTDWRRILAVFEGMGKEERDYAIELLGFFSRLETENQILLHAMARALPARRVQ